MTAQDDTRRPVPRTDARTTVVGLACVLVSMAAATAFLPHQSLWNDETTQLFGLTLSPVEAVRWLCDYVDYDFGVPDDRMPPLSYLAGWGWSRVFGLAEPTMRWFGVTCVAAATWLVFATAHRAWGVQSAVASSLLLGLSPNAVTLAVEIRAYPLFILTSAAALYCLGRLVADPGIARGRWLTALTACWVAAMYTHFYGLVLAGGTGLAVAWLYRSRGWALWPLVAAAGVTAILAGGLTPFILAGAGISTPDPEMRGKAPMRLVQLAYRSFCHPAVAVRWWPVVLCLGGAAVALGAAVASARHRPALTICLLVALVSGAAVTAAATLVATTFNAAASTYSSWMLPALALFLSAGLSDRSRSVKLAAAVGVSAVGVSYLFAAAQLGRNGDSFAHTAFGPLAERVERYGPADSTIIYDDPPDAPSWSLHAPLRYTYGGRLPEYRHTSGEGDGARVADFIGPRRDVSPSDLPTRALIVVRTRTARATDVARQINTGVTPIGEGPVTRSLLKSDRWRRVEEASFGSFVTADIDVFERAGD